MKLSIVSLVILAADGKVKNKVDREIIIKNEPGHPLQRLEQLNGLVQSHLDEWFSNGAQFMR